MEIKLIDTLWHEVDADWLVLGVTETAEMTPALAALDAALGGSVARMRESRDLSGKHGETLVIHDVPGIAAQRLLLVGLGESGKLNVATYNKAMMSAVRKASTKQDRSIAIALPETGFDGISLAQCAETLAVAMHAGAAGQDLYRAEPDHFEFRSAQIVVIQEQNGAEIGDAIRRGSIVGDAINLTRELVNRPAQDVYPQSVAERAQQIANDAGLKCDVLNEDQLRNERMGSLLAVAQGSEQPPRVVMLEYKGGNADSPTLALVGKGVTFDSGGLSMKTNEGMLTMKCDMAGAATVLGAMSAIARLELPVNVVGYLGLVENMVSGRSYKLGDVLTARNGVTIEVHNTDAEGRLVLADVLSLAVDRGADKLVDLATLTGACVVALGEEFTGAFSNDEDWCQTVLKAARQTGEPVWQMPMDDQFAELLKSDVADVKNVGPRWGGAITAAKFLEKFVDDKPWVHLDIAGPAFASSNKPHREGGATGCMVRTLIALASGEFSSTEHVT